MKTYETTFICSPKLSTDEVNIIVDKVKNIITKEGGTIINISDWGKKRLAYQIKKHREGHYIHIVSDTTQKTVSLLNNFYNINENVIRYLTVCAHPSSLIKMQQPMAQPEKQEKIVETVQSEPTTTEEVKSDDITSVTNE